MSNLQINTRVRRLSYYLDDFERGNFRIPFFQRRYKWSPEFRRDLFDSIIKGFPIGTILLWKPKHDVNINPEFEDRSIGSYNLENANENASYILDGFQRLSTIVGCLTNPNSTSLIRDDEEWFDNFNLIYNFKNDKVEISKESVDKLDYYKVPLYKLADTKEFYNIQTKFAENKNLLNELEIKNYISKYKDIAYRIQDYVLPSVDIDGGDFNTANEMFVRVNKRGEPVNDEEHLSAITSTERFRLGAKISNTLDEIEKLNFFNKKKKEAFRVNIFRTIQSSFGPLYLDTKATDVKTLSDKSDFSKMVNLTLDNSIEVVKFLKEELLILDLKFLPANLHFIFLVQYFNIKNQPLGSDIKVLKKWFWKTTYANYFTVFNPSKRKKAFEHFLDFAKGHENDPFYFDEDIKEFYTEKFPNVIDFGGVRKIALALFMVNYSVKKNGLLDSSFSDFYEIKAIKELKLFKNEKSTENVVFVVEKNDELNRLIKNKKDLSFLLSKEYDGKFGELFITDLMRDEYAKGNIDRVLNLRKERIIKEEKDFVENILEIKYNI